MNQSKIRNFCIIAHIDHGKSTLADRLLEDTKTLSKKDMQNQVLDSMDLERERGITIKSHPIQIQYKHNDGETYIFNLIDTPGHVDFSYEVSRSLAACEGALLLVDAAQGVEAQTVSNTYLAIENNLQIIPIVNKVDLPSAQIEDVTRQIIELIGCDKNEIILASAKNGLGVDKSFPTDLLNSKNSLVAIMQTVCIPKSCFEVLQHPSLKNPVIGLEEHSLSSVPKTLIDL